MRRTNPVALPLILASGAAAAGNFSCPLLALPSGKQVPAQSLNLFDGPPPEMADLEPDNADTDSQKPYYWTFTDQEKAVWVMCHYAGSKLTRQFALPHAFKKCAVTGPLN